MQYTQWAWVVGLVARLSPNPGRERIGLCGPCPKGRGYSTAHRRQARCASCVSQKPAASGNPGRPPVGIGDRLERRISGRHGDGALESHRCDGQRAFRSAPLRVVMAESKLTPERTLLDSRQARFAQRLMARPREHHGPEEFLEHREVCPRLVLNERRPFPPRQRGGRAEAVKAEGHPRGKCDREVFGANCGPRPTGDGPGQL